MCAWALAPTGPLAFRRRTPPRGVGGASAATRRLRPRLPQEHGGARGRQSGKGSACLGSVLRPRLGEFLLSPALPFGACSTSLEAAPAAAAVDTASAQGSGAQGMPDDSCLMQHLAANLTLSERCRIA